MNQVSSHFNFGRIISNRQKCHLLPPINVHRETKITSRGNPTPLRTIRSTAETKPKNIYAPPYKVSHPRELHYKTYNRGRHRVSGLPTQDTSYSFQESPNGVPQGRWGCDARTPCTSIVRTPPSPLQGRLSTPKRPHEPYFVSVSRLLLVFVSHHASREGGGLSLRALFEEAKVEWAISSLSSFSSSNTARYDEAMTFPLSLSRATGLHDVYLRRIITSPPPPIAQWFSVAW